jgi:hypothetical protein
MTSVGGVSCSIFCFAHFGSYKSFFFNFKLSLVILLVTEKNWTCSQVQYILAYIVLLPKAAYSAKILSPSVV